MQRKIGFIPAMLAIIALTLALAVSASAGTWINNTSRNIMTPGTDGGLILVSPGDSVATVYVPTDGDLTRTAATPYYNPVAVRHTVTSTGSGDDQTVTLLGTGTPSHIYIWKVTGGPVSVFYDAVANTPAVAILRAGDRFQHDIRRRAATLVLQFAASGTCEILETNEAIE